MEDVIKNAIKYKENISASSALYMILGKLGSYMDDGLKKMIEDEAKSYHSAALKLENKIRK